MGLVMLWLGVGLLCGASHAVARGRSIVWASHAVARGRSIVWG